MPKNVEKLSLNYSPNFDLEKRRRSRVKYLIFHYTGMKSEKKAIKKLLNENSKVSCHYFIKRNGQIIQMVPDLYVAWHAGISFWKKDKSLNSKSIGIELSNPGHKNNYQNFPEKQIRSLIYISKYLKKKYNINVVGCKTIREKNKVALSSRNYLLSKGNLIIASKIVRKLINVKKNIKNKKNKNKYLLTVKNNFQKQFKIKIEYLELRDMNNLKLSNTINTSKLFVAYYLNGIRLIDNL